MALISSRGVGRPVDQDVVGVHVEPNTGVVIAAIADGLSSGSRSEHAAWVAVDAVIMEARDELATGKSAEEALSKAFRVAGAMVRALAEPGHGNPPSTTLAAVVVAPTGAGRAEITRAHLGDSRVYVLTASAGAELLTRDHSRAVEHGATDATAGWLTAWLGADAGFRAPVVHTCTQDGPAVVLLTTDGLHTAFDTTESLRVAAARGGTDLDPVRAAENLRWDALGARADDASVIAIPVNGPSSGSRSAPAPPPGTHGTGSEGQKRTRPGRTVNR